jgi:hypothetical protein
MLSGKQLVALSGNGAGLILDARKFSYDDLLLIVSEAGASVTIRYFDGLAYEQLKELALSTSSAVIFDTTG